LPTLFLRKLQGLGRQRIQADEPSHHRTITNA
jgi:hypothetical protein